MKFSEIPYERADIEQARREFGELMTELDRAAAGEEAFRVHRKFYRLADHWTTYREIAAIRHDIDTNDPFYMEERSYYDRNDPVFHSLQTAYQKKLYQSRWKPYLMEKIGKVAFRNIELAMKSIDDRIIPLMQEENALETQYMKLLANAKIEWRGETLNLSLMNPYLHSADRTVRRQAWEKYTRFFTENQEQLDDLYDRLVKNRTQQGQSLGYDNYLPLGDARMMRNCYNRDDMARFRKQVREDFVPFAEQLHERRRRRLGLDRLMYYDEGIYYTQGNPAPAGTPEQILQAGRKMYNELSPETGEFMDFMCAHELFDVLGRRTKASGGYMTYLPDYKAPFIFANFNGTSGDADVITHECGHAFQAYVIRDEGIREHADITMETAETHSMSMEFFTEPWMNLLFGERAQDYVDMHFEDAIAFIPYGTMVDEFQDIVYRNPELTPAQRDGVWHDLERQYKPHLDYTGNDYYAKGGFWQKQHHIYDCPLYYIDYCIAQANALQYRIRMERDYRGAWDSYLKLCRLSASDFFDGLVRKAGLDNPFEDGCLKFVAGKLGDLLS